MEYPLIDGQRYRIQRFGQGLSQELWGDYVITGVLQGNEILFTVRDYAGNEIHNEISFEINGETVTTTNKSYSHVITNEKTVMAHGVNIKGTTIFIPQNHVPTPTIEELESKINMLVITIGDMMLV